MTKHIFIAGVSKSGETTFAEKGVEKESMKNF